jgi:hypothetical protein
MIFLLKPIINCYAATPSSRAAFLAVTSTGVHRESMSDFLGGLKKLWARLEGAGGLSYGR